jgi:hypothetical protein
MQGKPVGTILAFVCLLVAFVAVPGAPSATEPGTEDAVALAISHVKENAAALGVGSADVADLAVTSAYRSRHNGVTHVNLNQRYRDRRRRARAGQLGDPGHREPPGTDALRFSFNQTLLAPEPAVTSIRYRLPGP